MWRLALTMLLAAAAVVAAVVAFDGRDERAANAATVAAPLISPDAPRSPVPRRPHVVMIVMDEFPIDAMLANDGRIDAVRYPTFAALAATGTWFKNAYTVYDSTTKAIPAVLNGRLPRPYTFPNYTDHPRTVFDLFGPRGYRIVRSEEATALCPPRYCRNAPRNRPLILPLLQNGRRERLTRFLDSIRPGRPTFWMKHVMLPHGPYLFLPSGKQTRRGWRDPLPGMNSAEGFDSPFLTDHNQQRLLLQIGYVDRELGKLFARMLAQGIFDQSLIVLAADHGISFEVGVNDRRIVNGANIDEEAPVPLFVKAPGQRVGRTDAAYASTIDIVPTMADVLNVRMPYRADGRSAFSRFVRGRRTVRMRRRGFDGSVVISARRLEARRRALVRRKNRLFGSGDIRTLYTGIGPYRQLLGRAPADLSPAPRGRIRAAVVGGRALGAVSARSLLLPTHIAGPIRGGRRGARRNVAVSVNGRIEAVGRTFYLRGSRQESFAVNVPEAVLRPGRNAVEIYEITLRGRGLRLLGRA